MRCPSFKEINQKIKQAEKAISEHRISLINPINIATDALELGFCVEGIDSILIKLLEEITPRDYLGQSPPQRSYEDKITGCELYPFRWMSRHLGCRVYLKFTLKQSQFWLVSLHEDRT